MMSPPASPPSNSATGPSVHLTTESVIAAYIHDISDRHRRVDHGPRIRPGRRPATESSRAQPSSRRLRSGIDL
jgi:hypothetical protein